MTRSRNKRRRESRKLIFIKSKGILPATATKSDLKKFEDETSESERQKLIAVGGVHAAFEAKRQDLLASITAGGVDVSLDPSLLQERDNGMIQSRSSVGDPLSKAAAHEDTFMTDQPANEESLIKAGAEQRSGTGPIGISLNARAQDITTGMPAKAEDNTQTDSVVPTPDAPPPVESMESPTNVSQGVTDSIEASKLVASPAPESQHRRSKLDVSSAKRMLFGSLGLRTPKTKSDEMKMRDKLMKDVRPVKEVHVKEKFETMEDVAAAAEDESWKDKIDLRAVECCHEGIELSTPPFPFVQRWDPQQQRGYNMSNAKKRKGKKRKRNNNDYYEDNSLPARITSTPSHNYDYYDDNSKDPQDMGARLNGDDSSGQECPSTEKHNVEGNNPEHSHNEKPNVEGNDPEHSHDERFEDSVKVSAQLLHEIEDTSANTLVEMEGAKNLTNDLPNLPEDVSIFPSLALDKVAKGDIVAFKQLEMSAETNWQPRISEYRTAIVDEMVDDGTLSVTLAKRDQLSKNIQYDERTGERLYSKFEMPGYHDEYGEDRNGKLEISFDDLINPVLVAAASGKDDQDVMLQGRDDLADHTKSNNKAITEEAHDIDVASRGFGLDGPVQDVYNKATESSPQAQHEISELIRNAGWRSSIDHEFIDGQDIGPSNQGDEATEQDEAIEPVPSSPPVHGFSSSPLTNGFQVASSPPAATVQSSRHVPSAGSEIADSVPQRSDRSPARSDISNRRSTVDYPDLRQTNDDSEGFQQEAQDRSGLLEVNHQIASQDLTTSSSMRRSPSQSNASPILTSPETSSFKPIDVSDTADSDESLPELFSQAFEKRMSQQREIKSEISKENSISPPRNLKSKRSRRANSSQRETNSVWKPAFSNIKDEDEDGSTPRQSQTGFSSQIIDLTISSDTVDPPNDSYIDDDSYILPKGPGWVQKPNISKSRDVRRKTTTRGSLSRY